MIDDYKVYVKTDQNGNITAINSNAFLTSLDGWQEIDSGTGDKYHHAQGNYLAKPLFDYRGLFNYKLENGAVIERTEEEMSADYVPPVIMPTLDERLEKLEKAFTIIEGLVKGLSK